MNVLRGVVFWWIFWLISGCAGSTTSAPTSREETAFQRWDVNQDGRIDTSEAPRRAFMRNADQDGDGFVTLSEFQQRPKRAAQSDAAPPPSFQKSAEAFPVTEPDVPARRKRNDAVHLAQQTEADPDSFAESEAPSRRKRGEETPRRAKPVEGNFSLREQIAYAQLPGVNPASLSLDIYTPKDSKDASQKKYPVLIYVHGGSWKIGDKRNVQNKPAFFTRHGYLFVSVNYRRLPEGKHPNNVQDIARAVVWIFQHIADYQGDSQALFLMGYSAGAHLVSLVSTDARWIRRAGAARSVIKKAIALDTNALDVPALMAEDRQFFREAFGDDTRLWEEMSPAYQVKPGVSIPPFLLVYSNDSRKKQMENFAQRLKDAQIPVQLIAAQSKTHESLNKGLGESDDDPVSAAVLRFLQDDEVGH